MSDDDRGNVFEFPQLKELRESGGPASLGPNAYRHEACRHTCGVWVYPKDRRICCKRCNAIIDPFDAMVMLVESWDWAHTRAVKRDAELEAKRLTEEVAQLKKARSKARATGGVSVNRLHKVFGALNAKLNQHANQCLADGNKSAANSLSYVLHWVREARAAALGGTGDDA